MKLLKRAWRRVQCFVRGHSRTVVFQYLYREGPGVPSVVDDSMQARCSHCWALLPCTTKDGVVTLPGMVQRPAGARNDEWVLPKRPADKVRGSRAGERG